MKLTAVVVAIVQGTTRREIGIGTVMELGEVSEQNRGRGLGGEDATDDEL